MKSLDVPGFLVKGLESIYINNKYFQSNEKGTAAYSQDGSKLVCAIGGIKKYSICITFLIISKLPVKVHIDCEMSNNEEINHIDHT